MKKPVDKNIVDSNVENTIEDKNIPTRKKPMEKKSFSLNDFKQKNNLNDEVKDKTLDYIRVSPAFEEATGLGIAIGYVSIVAGFSSVGKSTLVMEAIVGSQKKGILPVIIDLENNFSFERAKLMGMEFEEVCDEETGEINGYDGFFLYINSQYILDNYDKKRNNKLKEPTIEGLAACINHLLDEQEDGNLDYSLLITLDSIGVLADEKSALGSRNNQFAAGAYATQFQSLLNYRIPASRKMNRQYTNTVLAVNKIWLDNMNGSSIKMKGGETFFYSARAIYLLGGQLTHGTRKLYAECTYKGVKYSYQYGIEVKAKCIKNHITGVSTENKIISTMHKFISVDGVEEYKKENKLFLLSKLGIPEDADVEIKTTEIVTKDEDVD
jgi:hypothetical protein